MWVKQDNCVVYCIACPALPKMEATVEEVKSHSVTPSFLPSMLRREGAPK